MKCPGQDTRFWKDSSIFEAQCPKCRSMVEFFKDDTTRKCGACGHRFLNPGMDFGCAAYCPYAEQCIGDLPPELIAQKEDLFKDRVAVAVKRYFGTDFARIGHSVRTAGHAERIAKGEGANPAVVLCASYLYAIGSKAAEEKYGSTAREYQEIEGEPIARDLLENLSAPPALAEEVCAIVGRKKNPEGGENVNFKVVSDADLIATLEEKQKKVPDSPEKIEKIIEKFILTGCGATIARETLIG